MYTILPLPYQYQDLEPFIDTHTVAVHYRKHLTNYLDKLNSLLKKANCTYKYTLPQVLNHINEYPSELREDILYNLGGVLNHDLYFRSISPIEDKDAKGMLKDQIIRQYGSMDNLKKQMKDHAMALKGSGYTFLVVKPDRTLLLMNVSNQETPLKNSYLPLCNIDMWEHAYYLNYENEKEKYIDNFFLIMNLSHASDVYNKFMSTKRIQ